MSEFTERDVRAVLDSAPRGFPRPLIDGLPAPWIAKDKLGDIDVFRRACAVMLRLCQVCGEPLGQTAVVWWRPGDLIVIDGCAVHPERCAGLADRLCPALKALADAGTLRRATVLTVSLKDRATGEWATEEGMPRAYSVPTLFA